MGPGAVRNLIEFPVCVLEALDKSSRCTVGQNIRIYIIHMPQWCFIKMGILFMIGKLGNMPVHIINPRIPGPSYVLKYPENVIFANKVLMAILLIICSV